MAAFRRSWPESLLSCLLALNDAMHPRIAIVDNNTLQAIGLKCMLSEIIPKVEISIFFSFADFSECVDASFFHYFVSPSVLVEHVDFFLENRNKTIVMVGTAQNSAQMTGFRTLMVAQPEDMLVRSLLKLHQAGHSHGYGQCNIPETEITGPRVEVSPRESEVLALLVKGLRNKEIADKLNISLTTVITHRKNISEKLGLKSVSALTVYAVVNGLVGIDEI